jgi:DNA mismatch repair ATPase MutS
MRPHWLITTEEGDWRQIIASATLYPVYLKLHLQAIAEIDCWLAIGRKISQNQACSVSWRRTKQSLSIDIRLQEIYDTACNPEMRKPFNFSIGNTAGHSHYLLTGPNRGGKSTALRSLASCIILAHSFGTSLGKSAAMMPIDSFSICLRPDDLPGQKSRFEREVEFAWGCLKKRGTQFILIDELFHSTNPPDAEEASRLFTQELWNKKGAVSIISTHLFNFVEGAPDSIGRLCCPATLENSAETAATISRSTCTPVIKFSYEVQPGICKVSSVQYLIDTVVMRDRHSMKPAAEPAINSDL